MHDATVTIDAEAIKAPTVSREMKGLPTNGDTKVLATVDETKAPATIGEVPATIGEITLLPSGESKVPATIDEAKVPATTGDAPAVGRACAFSTRGWTCAPRAGARCPPRAR